MPFVAGALTGTDGVHGGGYTLSIPAVGTFTNNSNNLTGSINSLASNFFYYASNPAGGSETLTLTGLTTGRAYQAVFYSVGFGGAGTRVQNVSDDQGGTLPGYDQNVNGNGNGTELIDTYVATGPSITFTFTGVAGNASFHQYGFSNQQVVPEPGSAALLGGLGLGLLGRRRRA